MGIWQRSLEDRASELADELALKQTGREFGDLSFEEQYSIWSQAEQSVREDMITAAERILDARRGN